MCKQTLETVMAKEGWDKRQVTMARNIAKILNNGTKPSQVLRTTAQFFMDESKMFSRKWSDGKDQLILADLLAEAGE